jgi:hypothetical protein
VEVHCLLGELRDSKNVAGPVLRADAVSLVRVVRAGGVGRDD